MPHESVKVISINVDHMEVECFEFFIDWIPYSFIRWVDLHANKGGNVKIDVHGSENIPAENGFMFFPNHQGLYDVLAMIEACPRPFSVVAKKEVGNIPVFKAGLFVS